MPAVGKGQGRVRVGLSAAHGKGHFEPANDAFKKVGEKYGVSGLGKKEVIDKYGT